MIGKQILDPYFSVKLRLFKKRIVDPVTGCWNWTGFTTKCRRGVISCNGKHWRVHRISYVIFVGPIPDGLNVLHKCDNTICFNPEHLFTGTQKDNVIDMHNKNRNANLTGENGPNAKLTWKQAREIRKEYAEIRISMDELANRYGIGYSTVWFILHNISWKETGV